jgi:3-oxoadipate enol-lactonase
VLLLHGWTATADLNWHPSYRPLSNHFRIIAMDHRGHGRGLRGRFRLEDCADDAAMVLEQLEVDRCIAVGYSMGGPIAQLLHRRRPELVNGLVLCATSAAFTANARDHLLCGLATSSRFLARAIPMQPLGAVALGACRSWSTLMSGGWWGYEQVARHDWTQIIEAGRQTLRFDSRAWLATTEVPTAVIATDSDDLVPHARQLALAAAIPGATLRIVDGGHTACTDAPGRFVPALVDACLEVADRAAAGSPSDVAA